MFAYTYHRSNNAVLIGSKLYILNCQGFAVSIQAFNLCFTLFTSMSQVDLSSTSSVNFFCNHLLIICQPPIFTPVLSQRSDLRACRDICDLICDLPKFITLRASVGVKYQSKWILVEFLPCVTPVKCVEMMLIQTGKHVSLESVKDEFHQKSIYNKFPL